MFLYWLYFHFIFALFINFKFSLAPFKVCSVSLGFQQFRYDVSRFCFVLILLGYLGASRIYSLLFLINFGKYLAIISSNIFSVLFFLFFTNYMYTGLFDTVLLTFVLFPLFFLVFYLGNFCLWVYWFFCIQCAGKGFFHPWYHILLVAFDFFK